ncbi:MAG: carbon monoxide dehydrogenase subunit G [Alphaproteobacteria bacterium]
MDMSGEYRIAAPRARVWEALNDAEILKQCIPGCQSLERLSATELTAKVVAKVGPVKATFTGAVTLSDLTPPQHYKISGEGKGGAAGFARGGAEVNLEEVGPAETVLRYTAQANVGGKLAQIGSRLIDGMAKKLSDEFFGKFAEVVANANAPAASAANGAPPKPLAAEPGERPTASGSAAGLPPVVWIAGVVILVIALLALFAL